MRTGPLVLNFAILILAINSVGQKYLRTVYNGKQYC